MTLFKNQYTHLLITQIAAFLVFPFIETVHTELSLISLIFFVVIFFSLKTLETASKISHRFWMFALGAFSLDVLLWLYAPKEVKKSILVISLLLYACFLIF